MNIIISTLDGVETLLQSQREDESILDLKHNYLALNSDCSGGLPLELDVVRLHTDDQGLAPPPPPVPAVQLVHKGRCLADRRTISHYRLKDNTKLYLVPLLNGGGNDGGSIPTRGEMVRTKKTERKIDELLLKRSKWLTCHLSKQALTHPIVADELGNLFNKVAILKGLIEKSLPSSLDHIRSIKNVYSVVFTENRKYDSSQQVQVGMVDGSRVTLDSPYECPLTGWPVNGQHAFSALKTCGHAFSEKGLQQICNSPSSSSCNDLSQCFVCQKPFSREDILVLNPLDDLKQRLISKFQERKVEKKKLKKEEEGSEESNSGQKKKEVVEVRREEKEETIEKEEKKESTKLLNNSNNNNNNNNYNNNKKEKSKDKPPVTSVKRQNSIDNNKQPTKKQKVSQSPNARNVLSVACSLQQVGTVHDSKKQTSNAYRSIFSSEPSFAPMYLTGIVKGVIK